MVRQNMNHERSPIPVLTGPSVENYMYGDRDQRATIICQTTTMGDIYIWVSLSCVINDTILW